MPGARDETLNNVADVQCVAVRARRSGGRADRKPKGHRGAAGSPKMSCSASLDANQYRAKWPAAIQLPTIPYEGFETMACDGRQIS